MRKFKNPVEIDFAGVPLAGAAVHLLLVVVALALTAALWLGAARTSRSHASLAARTTNKAVRHVDLPLVVIVGHRDRTADPADTAMAGLASADRSKVSPGARVGDAIRGTLQ
ncbi:MAG TPA: hypothetical protein VKP68_08630 [Ramlibacter sp.]|nr:hypothetical protein [Ramlibacter sp.]